METSVLLRDIVANSSVSKVSLAEQAGISRTALFRILSGQGLPKLGTLRRILNALGADETASASVLKAFDVDRYENFQTDRKQVRAAKDRFISSLMVMRHVLLPSGTEGPGWAPDLWFSSSIGELPIYVECKVRDLFSIIGRAYLARENSASGSQLDWKAWLCVEVLSDPVSDLEESLGGSEFPLQIVTRDVLCDHLDAYESMQDECSESVSS